MTYDLRRLRLHGLIEKIPQTHRYQVTREGLCIGLFFTKVYARVFRPGLSAIGEHRSTVATAPIASALHRFEQAVAQHIQAAKLTPCEI